ncbi:HTH-type transcriptional activator Btr [compost metagenome]
MEKQKIDAVVPAPFLNYRQIVNYLDEQYANEITSQDIEAKLQKNYGYLCQIFKKYSGTTIHSYIQQLRVQRAKYLLLSSNKEINEISYEVGCQDPYYFSRLFKKWEGVSPLVYRTQKRV